MENFPYQNGKSVFHFKMEQFHLYMENFPFQNGSSKWQK